MSKHYHPMQGVEIWRNRKNRFVVFQLHYEADPAKRTHEYKTMIRDSLPYRDYMREYELAWDSWDGMPVYGDWNKRVHGTNDPLKPVPGVPLLRGWDFGLTPAVIVAQLVDGQLTVFKEFTHFNKGAEKFSEEIVLPQCRMIWPEWSDQKKHWIDVIDPSGIFRKDTDEGTCAKILDGKGLLPRPGATAWEERKTAVEYYLMRFTSGEASFKVILGECPMLTTGFDGGYRYSKKTAIIEPAKIRPLKDEHSHIHDALQMVCSWLRKESKARKGKRKIAKPDYGYG